MRNQVGSEGAGGGHWTWTHGLCCRPAAAASDNGRLLCCPTPKVSKRKIDSSSLSPSPSPRLRSYPAPPSTTDWGKDPSWMRGGQRSSPMRYVGCLLSNAPFMDATRRQPPHKRYQAPEPICFPTDRFHFSLKSLIMTPEVEDIGVRKAFVFKGIHLQSILKVS